MYELNIETKLAEYLCVKQQVSTDSINLFQIYEEFSESVLSELSNCQVEATLSTNKTKPFSQEDEPSKSEPVEQDQGQVANECQLLPRAEQKVSVDKGAQVEKATKIRENLKEVGKLLYCK